MIRSAVAVLAGLLALDPNNLCGPATGDDGGAGGDGSSGSPGTIEAECNEIVSEFCSQAINRCDVPGFDESECIASDMPQCCTAGASCSQKSTDTQSSIDQCKSDIDTADCNQIVNGLPDSCLGLLHP